MSSSFPKIIWQTHNHKSEWMPEHLRQIKTTWVNLNPGWEYRYVDQIQRDEKVREYPNIYEIYKYLLPSRQSDIWRFIVTYEEGGCYADMDSVCFKPLDYMLKGIQGDPEMITVPLDFWGKGNTHNYIVKANSLIMKTIIDEISTDCDFALANNAQAKDSFDMFVNKVYSSSNVSKQFDAAFHSLDFKEEFNYNIHKVDYYGEQMSYLSFLKKYNKTLIQGGI